MRCTCVYHLRHTTELDNVFNVMAINMAVAMVVAAGDYGHGDGHCCLACFHAG